MAKFRQIYTNFWSNPYIQEELTSEDKFFYLYLLTNEQTKQIGIYQMTKKKMAFDLGYSIESVNALVNRFEQHHKLIKYDENTREMAIIKWGDLNLNRGGKPVEDCIRKELEEIKNIELLKLRLEDCPNEAIKKIIEDFYIKYDTSTNRENEEVKIDGTPEPNENDSSYDTSHDTSAIKNKEERISNKEEVIKDKEKEEFVEALKDFYKMRDKIKKPLTLKAKERLKKRLEELSNGDINKKIEILNQSVDKCWQDVYELKDNKSQKLDKNSGSPVLTEEGFNSNLKKWGLADGNETI